MMQQDFHLSADEVQTLLRAVDDDLVSVNLKADAVHKGKHRLVIHLPIAEADAHRYPLLRQLGRIIYIEGTAKIDLERELAFLWNEWQRTFANPRFAEYFDVDPDLPTSAQNAKFLEPMRKWGALVFDRLFVDLEISNHRGGAVEQVRHLLLETLAGNRRQINVTSNLNRVLSASTPGPRTFPWNFLFQNPPAGSGNWQDGFWGFRHLIEEAFSPPPSFKGLRANPIVLAMIDRDRDPRGYHDQPTHPFHPADASCVLVEATDTAHLLRLLREGEADIVYHFGHHFDDGSVINRRLTWGGHEVTLADVETNRCPQFRSDTVLIFLNACESGACDPTMTDTFLGRLCTERKTHCVATWAQTPWSVGARFSQIFWRMFLKEGRTAGDAMLETRRLLRDDPRSPNPLGLLYCYFGRLLLAAGTAR